MEIEDSTRTNNSRSIVPRGPLEHILLVQPEFGGALENTKLDINTNSSENFGQGRGARRSGFHLYMSTFNFPPSALEIRTAITRFDIFSMWGIRPISDQCTNEIKRHNGFSSYSNGRKRSNNTSTKDHNNNDNHEEKRKFKSAVSLPYQNPSPVLILGCTIGSLIPFNELIEGDVAQLISSFNMRTKDMNRDYVLNQEKKAARIDSETRMILYASRNKGNVSESKVIKDNISEMEPKKETESQTIIRFTNKLSSDHSISPSAVNQLISKNILPISFVILEEAGLTAEPDTLHALNVCSAHNENIRKAYIEDYIEKVKSCLMEDVKKDEITDFMANLTAPVFIFSGDPMQLSPFSYGKLGSLEIDSVMIKFINRLMKYNERKQLEIVKLSEGEVIKKQEKSDDDEKSSVVSGNLEKCNDVIIPSFTLPYKDIKNMYYRIYRSLIEESTMERMIRFNALIMEKTWKNTEDEIKKDSVSSEGENINSDINNESVNKNNRIGKVLKINPPFPTFFLRKQYRMHKEIASFPIKEFYGNIVKTKRSGENVQDVNMYQNNMPSIVQKSDLLNKLLIYRSPNFIVKNTNEKSTKNDNSKEPSKSDKQDENETTLSHSVFGPYVLFNLKSTETRNIKAYDRYDYKTEKDDEGDKNRIFSSPGLSKSVYNETECRFIISYILLLLRLHPYLCNDGVDMDRPKDSLENIENYKRKIRERLNTETNDLDVGSSSHISPIAVITPYAAQKKRLTELWNKTVYELYNFNETDGKPYVLTPTIEKLMDYTKSEPVKSNNTTSIQIHKPISVKKPSASHKINIKKTSQTHHSDISDVETIETTSLELSVESVITDDNIESIDSVCDEHGNGDDSIPQILSREDAGLMNYIPSDILCLRYKNIYNFLYSKDWKLEVGAMDFNTDLRYDYYESYIKQFLSIKPPRGNFPRPIPIQFQQILRSVTFNTIDGFQGQERSIIIVSLVRANSRGELGFVASRKRMNSALTRAKHAMVVVGNFDSLKKELPNNRELEDADKSEEFENDTPRKMFNIDDETCLEDTEDYDPYIVTRLYNDGIKRGVVANVYEDSLPNYENYSKNNSLSLTNSIIECDIGKIKNFIKLI